MAYETRCDSCKGEDCQACEYYQNDSLSQDEIDSLLDMDIGIKCQCGNIEYMGNSGFCEECGRELIIED